MALFTNYESNRLWCDRDANKAFTCVGNENNRYQFISSNGYYGYLPVYVEESNAMETNDAVQWRDTHRTATFQNATSPGNNHPERLGTAKPEAPPRKRNSSDVTDENFKRIRKEESHIEGATGYQVPLALTTRNSDYHYPRCTMGHYVTSNEMPYRM